MSVFVRSAQGHPSDSAEKPVNPTPDSAPFYTAPDYQVGAEIHHLRGGSPEAQANVQTLLPAITLAGSS